MNLSNTLKELRLKKGGLSQQQLAEMVGCSRQSIIAIETGCKNPSVELALKISLALDTPVNELFSLEEGKEKEKFCQKISDFFNLWKKKSKT
ncbi:MAG: helix-turn-helix transcriptional regulator [Bacteriovoracaceae bacterium]|nr:helix-turn-helix transcriptional regulator [Bacteriovoracaceae bacterium]